MLLIVVAALYRIIPSRPMGFAPQIAMAIFGGAIVKDKKWAFALPIFSMFLSDLLYQGLFAAGLTPISGFYDGQLLNYAFLAGITLVGFLITRVNVAQVLMGSFAGSILYYFASNTAVWASGGGYSRPRNFAGWMQCMADGAPFFRTSLIATVVFAGLLFGTYYLVTRRSADAARVS